MLVLIIETSSLSQHLKSHCKGGSVKPQNIFCLVWHCTGGGGLLFQSQQPPSLLCSPSHPSFSPLQTSVQLPGPPLLQRFREPQIWSKIRQENVIFPFSGSDIFCYCPKLSALCPPNSTTPLPTLSTNGHISFKLHSGEWHTYVSYLSDFSGKIKQFQVDSQFNYIN